MLIAICDPSTAYRGRSILFDVSSGLGWDTGSALSAREVQALDRAGVLQWTHVSVRNWFEGYLTWAVKNGVAEVKSPLERQAQGASCEANGAAISSRKAGEPSSAGQTGRDDVAYRIGLGLGRVIRAVGGSVGEASEPRSVDAEPAQQRSRRQSAEAQRKIPPGRERRESVAAPKQEQTRRRAASLEQGRQAARRGSAAAMEHQQRRPEYGTPKPDSGTEELDKHGETQSSAGTRESSAPRDRRFRSFRAEQQQELDEFVQWEEVLLEQEEYYGSELRPGEDGVHVHDPIDEMLADALPSNEEWNAALGIEPEDNWDVAGAS